MFVGRQRTKPFSCIVQSMERAILKRFDTQTWDKILNIATEDVLPIDSGGQVVPRVANLAEAANTVTGLQTEQLWEMVSEVFLNFCETHDYKNLFRATGRTYTDLLNNLNTLHDTLYFLHPNVRTPTFQCHQAPDSLVLHQYSEEEGLESLIAMILKKIGKDLYGLDCTVSNTAETLASGEFHTEYTITYQSSQSGADSEMLQNILPKENCISPDLFCKLFPYHLIFDRNLKIIQAGNSVIPLIREVACMSNCYLYDIFTIEKPNIILSFEGIQRKCNTVFVVSVKIPKRRCSIGHSACPLLFNSPVLETIQNTNEKEDCGGANMQLRGQMMYIPESDCMMYLCSPNVHNFDDLATKGFFMSDIPLHDATRDLILLSEQCGAEYELRKRLENITEKLQDTFEELEMEKELTDKLVYSILPPSVADSLRMGKPVQAVKFNSVTLLFTGMRDFQEFCTNSEPMKVVNLLNELYTKFDILADIKCYNVYKVETVGDKYMLASGLPVRSTVHALDIALVALDMLAITRELKVEGQSFKVTVGLHSGEVVAGVIGQKLPRYAVFGNTVCLASRMETTGVPDKINISEATYQYLQTPDCYNPHFIFEDRGKIPIKGVKEPMNCYFLSRRQETIPIMHRLAAAESLVTSPGINELCCRKLYQQKFILSASTFVAVGRERVKQIVDHFGAS